MKEINDRKEILEMSKLSHWYMVLMMLGFFTSILIIVLRKMDAHFLTIPIMLGFLMIFLQIEQRYWDTKYFNKK